jgi:hypothetical protein
MRSFCPGVDINTIFNIDILNLLEFNGLISVVFYAGMLPSIWVWVYVAALLATRALVRNKLIVDKVRWFLNFDDNPYRSLGAVAAVMMFVCSCVIVGLRRIM